MGKGRIAVLSGNDAIAEGAIAAGMRFFAGYPITPASEISHFCADELPKYGGKFIQMEDEIGSMAAIIGASMAGGKSMTSTSGPGFSLMQENLGFAIMAEVPCVVVDVMRFGPSQGVATVPAQADVMQARWGTHGDHPSITLAPSTVEEAYHVTVRAFNMAEKYRTPVIILSDATLSQMSEKIEIPGPDSLEILNRKKATIDPEQFKPYQDDGTGICPFASYGNGYIWYTTGIVHDETGFPATGDPDKLTIQINRLYDKINENLDDIIQVDEYMTEDAEIVVLAYGSVARSAFAAADKARNEGIKVGVVKPITIWPFPEDVIKKVREKVESILVCEMNHGQLFEKVKETVEGKAKMAFLGQYNGKLIKPDKILAAIKEVSSGVFQ